ncbi:fungal-specific transcription factor-like protein [Plectosphaerella plurivora]|uniref:Fungal-specific transcription factor-like protein n=1 Tax=Plectosphaerella plurivora TaxID=936078 RepID=A0A9P8V4Q2_9PEZI|nr:fungal-specific transcription factor-like protein [Plectosphaerella plurivora]
MSEKGSTRAEGSGSFSGPRPRGPRGPRVRACAECKRLKIRCEVRRGELACARCLRSGIECMPHDPAQRLHDEDIAWKTQAQAQISQLQAAVAALLQREKLPDLATFKADILKATSTSPADSALGSVSNAAIAPIDMRVSRHPSPERGSDDPGLVPVPMRNLYELTRSTDASSQAVAGGGGGNGGGASSGFSHHTSPIEEDLIAKGVISLAEGELLFERYIKGHHPLLWGGTIFPYTTLEAVRRASTLLSTAVFTVASLHSPDKAETLQKCYDAFVSLASASSLARGQNIDDIRGMCLGAFYLPNLSWRLVGQAVRMAAEMNIHQSFQKLLNGDVRHHERVRLWYALYVCDRHFSVLYGRPSAMYDDAAIKGVERFLESPAFSSCDVRISAQVALFKILSEVYLEFGSDQNQALSEQDLDKLRMFNIAIEQWRLVWQPRSHDAPGIGSYPSMGVVMFYHFARFHLNSLALRGVRWPSNEPLWLNRREAAMTAISAAMSTLVHIMTERDIREHLKGVPLFTYVMVAFCATFLLKMAIIWGRGGDNLSQALGLGLNTAEVISLTRRAADMLTEVSGHLSDKHLARLIVAGIREMLQRVTPQDEAMGGINGGQGGLSSTAAGAVGATGAAAGGMDLNHGINHSHLPKMETTPRGTAAAADFATEQMGDGVHDMVYNMDLDSLVGLLEYGSEETFMGGQFSQGDFDWGSGA